jgi:hypothetical protein
MQMRAPDFWRLSLAEWRAKFDGYANREQQKRRQSAWEVQHHLVAAGMDADKVTVAKLLGEDEPRERARMSPEERKRRDVEKMLTQFEKHGLLKAEPVIAAEEQ